MTGGNRAGYRDSEGKGIEPLPWPGRERRDFTCDRLRPFLLSGTQVIQQVHRSITTTPRLVGCACQLGHVRKERWRLTNEKPHIR